MFVLMAFTQRALFGLLAGLFAGVMTFTAQAADCRQAFDVGSSGVRVGQQGADVTLAVSVDYLSPIWGGRGIGSTLPATVGALTQLPSKAQLASGCQKVAGGFSAWRLAFQQDPQSVIDTLQQINTQTGAALFVIPQAVEAHYGYVGAHQALGSTLKTTHILDIGGGSYQLVGIDSSVGGDLGQKSWQKRLCEEVLGQPYTHCTTVPMTSEQLEKARTLLAEHVSSISRHSGKKITVTAISKPVTKGIAPAMAVLLKTPVHADIELKALSSVIFMIQKWSLPELGTALSLQTPFANALLSDMLLLEAILQKNHIDRIRVAEAGINNVTGLLQDPNLWAYQHDYACYLRSLGRFGIDLGYEYDAFFCHH